MSDKIRRTYHRFRDALVFALIVGLSVPVALVAQSTFPTDGFPGGGGGSFTGGTVANATTFSSDVAVEGTFTNDNLTAGRAVIVGTGGLITDDAGLTYAAGTDALTTGRILVGPGSETAPSIAFSDVDDGTGTGIYGSAGANVISQTINGDTRSILTNTQMRYGSGVILGWTAGVDPISAAADTAWVRAAPAKIAASHDGTASNSVQFRLHAINTTTTDALTDIENGAFTNNQGDTDGVAITLINNPTTGSWASFCVTASTGAGVYSVTPDSGETLTDGAASPGTCSAMTSNVVGSCLIVVAGGPNGSGSVWRTLSQTGTWTCVP